MSGAVGATYEASLSQAAGLARSDLTETIPGSGATSYPKRHRSGAPRQPGAGPLDGAGQVLGDPDFETHIESGPVGLPEEMKGQARLLAALFIGQEAKMTLTESGPFTLRLLVNDEVIATTDFRVARPHQLGDG
jgi:hypothetical protein